MACDDCRKWENQAKTNLQTVYQQAELIKGLKLAIETMVKAMKGMK